MQNQFRNESTLQTQLLQLFSDFYCNLCVFMSDIMDGLITPIDAPIYLHTDTLSDGTICLVNLFMVFSDPRSFVS